MSDFVLESTRREFGRLKSLAEDALAQIPDDHLHSTLGRDQNSAAVLVKHISGNLRSRWTDFLTTDGEKPWRQRDSEFEQDPAADGRAALLERWEEGWQTLFDTLASLSDADLERTVTLRGERTSVLEAIHRQMTHYAYHVGQLVLLARHHAGEEWRTLSIPRAGPSRPQP